MARQIAFDKEDVINKCMDQFWVHGFEKTSLNDLENCTGLKRTSLYNSYGNKDEIFRIVIEHYINTKCVYWTNILLKESTFEKGVDKLMSTMIRENMDGKYPTGCLITYSAAGIEHHCEAIRNAIIKAHEVMIEGLSKGIERDINTGLFKKETDVKSLALYILNNFQGIMVLSKTLGNEENLNKVKDFTLELIKNNQVA